MLRDCRHGFAIVRKRHGWRSRDASLPAILQTASSSGMILMSQTPCQLSDVALTPFSQMIFYLMLVNSLPLA
jgi:hypothetical protein